MQEHRHVKTTPGEPVSPEIAPNAGRTEPGSNTQAEDINIPLVVIAVLFFATFLTVAITGLQAAFYNFQDSERTAKQAAEGGPGTPLGVELSVYHHDLEDGGWNDRPGYGEGNKIRRISIDAAMDATIALYANRGDRKAK